MKIQKNLPVQTEEIEIQLPAYFKKNDYYYKVNEDEKVSMIHAHPSNMLILTQAGGEPVEKVVTKTPITEQEWNEALKNLADYFGQFMCNQGLTECGYPLPEPEDFEQPAY